MTKRERGKIYKQSALSISTNREYNDRNVWSCYKIAYFGRNIKNANVTTEFKYKYPEFGLFLENSICFSPSVNDDILTHKQANDIRIIALLLAEQMTKS